MHEGPCIVIRVQAGAMENGVFVSVGVGGQ
jgi:hypothetical protein